MSASKCSKNQSTETDAVLLSRVREGSPFEKTEAFATLERRYRPLLTAEVDRFRKSSLLSQTDHEDLMQEASIVLLRAASRYDLSQKKVTFGLYLKICLRRALISVLRHEQSLQRRSAPSARRRLGGSYVPRTRSEKSLSRKAKLQSAVGTLGKSEAEDPTSLPYQQLLVDLTPLEREVFRLYCAGYGYREIAQQLSKSEKSVDNALFRARRKTRLRLEAHLQPEISVPPSETDYANKP